MNGLGAVQHSSNMQSCSTCTQCTLGCKCTTGANKQSDAIITLLPSDKVDCFRRSVVKIHFLSRKEICKNIQGHLGRLSTSYTVVEFLLQSLYITIILSLYPFQISLKGIIHIYIWILYLKQRLNIEKIIVIFD